MGRKTVDERETLFYKLCECLESEVEHGVMTLVQVHQVLQQLDPSPDKSLAYSKKWLKKNSKKSIMKLFILHHKLECRMCKDKASTILREHHVNLQLGEEKNQIIKTALKLICNDIATINLDPKTYPTVQNMGNISSQLALVPESLQMVLRPILMTDEKVAIWGQNFIKAYRPRSGVLPYQMGLAIQLDHKFGSKWMLDKLHRLGCSESYAELHNYKYCFLNNKKRVGTSNSSGTLDTIVEETDDQINAEFEVDVELKNLSALTTISESEIPNLSTATGMAKPTTQIDFLPVIEGDLTTTGPSLPH